MRIKRIILYCILTVSLLDLLACKVTKGAYFASPEGKDCITCGKKPKDPFKSIRYAVRFLTPGDTLILLDGIYRESRQISQIPSGLASSPVVIKALNPGKAVVKAPIADSDQFIFYFQGINTNKGWIKQSNIVLDGLVLDGNRLNKRVPIMGLIKISEAKSPRDPNRYADSISIVNSRLHNSSRVGILVRGGSGHRIVDSNIEDIRYYENSGRKGERANHITGIYIATSGNQVVRNTIINVTSNGVLVYDTKDRDEPDNNSIEDNTISYCKRGISLNAGKDNVVRGNVITDTELATYISKSSIAVKVLENTFYHNRLGILVDSEEVTTHKVESNIFYGIGKKELNVGIMVKSAEVEINNNMFYNHKSAVQYHKKIRPVPGNSFDARPNFQDADRGDFRLKKSSPEETDIGPKRLRESYQD